MVTHDWVLRCVYFLSWNVVNIGVIEVYDDNDVVPTIGITQTTIQHDDTRTDALFWVGDPIAAPSQFAPRRLFYFAGWGTKTVWAQICDPRT